MKLSVTTSGGISKNLNFCYTLFEMDRPKVEQFETEELQRSILPLTEVRSQLTPTQEQKKFLTAPHPPYNYLKNLVREGKELIVIGEDHSEPEHQKFMTETVSAFFYSLFQQAARTGGPLRGINLFLEIHQGDQQKVRDFITDKGPNPFAQEYPSYNQYHADLARRRFLADKEFLDDLKKRAQTQYFSHNIPIEVHCIGMPMSDEELIRYAVDMDEKLWAQREMWEAEEIVKIAKTSPGRIGLCRIGNAHAQRGTLWQFQQLSHIKTTGQYLSEKLGDQLGLVQQIGTGATYETIGSTDIFIEAARMAGLDTDLGFDVRRSPFASLRPLDYIWQYPNESQLMRILGSEGWKLIDVNKPSFRVCPKRYSELFDGIILHGDRIPRPT